MSVLVVCILEYSHSRKYLSHSLARGFPLTCLLVLVRYHLLCDMPEKTVVILLEPASTFVMTALWFCPELIDTFELPAGTFFELHRADIA